MLKKEEKVNMRTEQQIMNDDLQEAQYIGEDGAMCIDGRMSRQKAYQKMISRYAEDCGEEDAKDFQENWLKSPDDLGIGWLHLAQPEDQKRFEPDTEWFISYKAESPYKVWIYYA